MQKAQAQNLVRETLQNDFDKERFLYFVKNLLNKVDDSKAFHAHGYVPEAYKSYAKTYERLATYTDPTGSKLDILIVYLQKETSLERARTAQRNFVARYLKDRDQKDAGLIAFVSPDPADWRFSLVKMEYKFTEGKAGKTKIKEEFTPAKRWSFLVGKNENSHTAQSRLAPIVEDDQNNPTLKQLEDAFNIEKVTKEFFEKYRELFLRVYETLHDVIKQHPDIKADFAEKNVNTVDFSKKLLGQIVFLYFLQKKGWFGVPMNKTWGNGDKKFLRTLFEKASGESKNYFNDYLEPLFYEALAKERDDDFYSRFECKIPFLNGGLFDPISNYDWVNTAIDLPDDIFSNTRKTKDGDVGDGILDIFDRYNFTVKEDEPLEKEVAVDPEMLGKVFENLLEVKDRKSKGTYYTPREIVHYMCEQSLVNYLATELEGKVAKEDLEKLIKIGENVVEHEAVSVTKEDNPEYGGDYKRLLPDTIKDFANEIDDKLVTIKVCDPAIGSGAFPVGMMNAIVKARMVLSSYLKDKNRTLYTFKRDCIQNSLYGVDIDPGAVEIAKLRLWLSLVVDEDNIKQIKPLPNLDYKIMQGNSLLEEFEGIKLFDEKLIAIVDTGKEKQLESLKQKQAILQKEYFELHSQNKLTPAKQAELKSELKKLQAQVKKLNNAGLPAEAPAKAGLFDTYSEAKKKADDLKRLHKEFFEATQKSKKDNIKKQIEQLEWELIEATLKEQGKISALKKLEEFKRSNTKPFFLWKLNFADVFEEKGGFDVVIANPPYVGHKGGLKKFFKEIKGASLGKRFNNERMDLFYYFFHKSLDISKSYGEIAFITTNYYVTADSAIKLRADFKNRALIRKLIDFNEFKIFDSARGQHNMLTFLQKNNQADEGTDLYLTNRIGLATPDLLKSILEKEDVQTNYFNLSKADLYEGVNNYMRVFLWSSKGSLQVNKILEKIERQGVELISICKISQGLVTGLDKISKKHIFRANVLKNNEGKGVYVINDQEKNKIGNSPLIKPWFKNSDIEKYRVNEKNNRWVIHLHTGINIEQYKNIKKYIYQFENIIKTRNFDSGELSKAKKLGKWWALSSSRRDFDFFQPKIVSPQRSYENTFAYTEKEWLASADVYFITSLDFDLSLKYVLALLNSKLYYKWLFYRGKRKGKMLELYLTPLSEIPIKKARAWQQKPFIELVEKVLKITKTDDYLKNAEKQAKVHDLEHQIDGLVYKLYGLTEDEIKIVEAN